jgi:hypothetical protein
VPINCLLQKRYKFYHLPSNPELVLTDNYLYAAFSPELAWRNEEEISLLTLRRVLVLLAELVITAIFHDEWNSVLNFDLQWLGLSFFERQFTVGGLAG